MKTFCAWKCNEREYNKEKIDIEGGWHFKKYFGGTPLRK